MKPRAIDGLLLDLEGVVLTAPRTTEIELHMEGVRRAYDVLAASGAELPPFIPLFRFLFRTIQSVRLGLAFGNLREVDLEAEAAGLVRKMVPGAGDELVTGALDAWFAPFGRVLAPATGAVPVLGRLRKDGFRLHGALNSPWPRRLLAPALARSPLDGLLDGFTFSSEVGSRRPNLYFFSAALEAMGLPGASVAYVTAADCGHVEAAEEFDMLTVGLGMRRTPPYGPDLVAATLDDLPAILQPCRTAP